jgi:hypothetical protein
MMPNGSAAIVGTALQLTNGGTAQAGTAWYPDTVRVDSFTSGFDFQLPVSDADGFTFTIQNSRKKVNALGGNTSGLGYQFIPNSVTLAFGLYQSNVTNAQTLGVYTGGASPNGASIDLSGTGVNLHNGNAFHADLTYASGVLKVKLTDKTTGASTTQSFNVDIPTAVGSTSALVGFTGSTGGLTSIQNILNWTYGN